MASDSGGVYAGVATIIGAACAGFVIVYNAITQRRRNNAEETRREAVRLAAEILAEEMWRQRHWSGERRGEGDDDGNRRRNDD